MTRTGLLRLVEPKLLIRGFLWLEVGWKCYQFCLAPVAGSEAGEECPWHSRSINSWNLGSINCTMATEDWARMRRGRTRALGAMDQSKAEKFQPLQRHFRKAGRNRLCPPPHSGHRHSGSCSDGFIVI